MRRSWPSRGPRKTAGLEAFFRSDHYGSFPGAADLPTTDAWATLAGLARDTSRIGLGVLVSPVTFRLPGNLAKVVGTVAEMSDGRVELGLGAGWNEVEHRSYGLPFPPIGERFDMLEEQLAIIHGLWTEPDGWAYEGRHWQVERCSLSAPSRGGARRPATPEHHRRWQRRPAHGRARRALRGRVQPDLGERRGGARGIRARPRGVPRRRDATRRA